MMETECQSFLRLVLPPLKGEDAVSGKLPLFHKNEIVKGTVLKSFSTRSASLLIKGEKVQVRTLIPLKAGSVITLQVEKVTPTPVLKLIEPVAMTTEMLKISNILSAMKENLWKTIYEKTDRFNLTQDDKAKISGLMRDLSARIYEEPSATLLRNVINKTGLNWEANLVKILREKFIAKESLERLVENDFKGLLTKILMLNDHGDIHLKRLQIVLKNIQLLNQHGMKQDGKIFLPIPIQFPDGFFTVGQLVLQFPPWERESTESRPDSDKIYKISFVIELSRLGPLRIEFLMQGKRVQGQFLIADQRAKNIIERALPTFVSILKEKGYAPDEVKCFLEDPAAIRKSLIREAFYVKDFSVCLVA